MDFIAPGQRYPDGWLCFSANANSSAVSYSHGRAFGYSRPGNGNCRAFGDDGTFRHNRACDGDNRALGDGDETGGDDCSDDGSHRRYLTIERNDLYRRCWYDRNVERCLPGLPWTV